MSYLQLDYVLTSVEMKSTLYFKGAVSLPWKSRPHSETASLMLTKLNLPCLLLRMSVLVNFESLTHINGNSFFGSFLEEKAK